MLGVDGIGVTASTAAAHDWHEYHPENDLQFDDYDRMNGRSDENPWEDEREDDEFEDRGGRAGYASLFPPGFILTAADNDTVIHTAALDLPLLEMPKPKKEHPFTVRCQSCGSTGTSDKAHPKCNTCGDTHVIPIRAFGGKRIASLVRHAINETIAPPEVDTLRASECPICGSDAYNGEECPVCLFIKPPDMFMDPDLEAAQNADLRQDE